jgi:hypothetical protein
MSTRSVGGGWVRNVLAILPQLPRKPAVERSVLYGRSFECIFCVEKGVRKSRPVVRLS